MEYPGIIIAQVIGWLFREALHPSIVDYIVKTNSKEKFMEERPEHFA